MVISVNRPDSRSTVQVQDVIVCFFVFFLLTMVNMFYNNSTNIFDTNTSVAVSCWDVNKKLLLVTILC